MIECSICLSLSGLFHLVLQVMQLFTNVRIFLFFKAEYYSIVNINAFKFVDTCFIVLVNFAIVNMCAWKNVYLLAANFNISQFSISPFQQGNPTHFATICYNLPWCWFFFVLLPIYTFYVWTHVTSLELFFG